MTGVYWTTREVSSGIKHHPLGTMPVQHTQINIVMK